jgi:LPXTG-motif cell wall-anchored protein
MDMKLKKIALVVIALLVCMVGATAFAESPIAGTGEIISAPDGYTRLVIDPAEADDIAQCGIAAEGTLIAVNDIYITNQNGDRLAGEATIAINIANLKATDKVTITHLKDDGTCEVVEGVIVEDGRVIFTSAFSYFGFYVQTTTATSPKTGDANMILMLGIALIAVSLIVVSTRKLSKN